MRTHQSFQPFFSAMGCVASIVFSSFGAAYGTAKSSAGVFAGGLLRPDMAVRSKQEMDTAWVGRGG